MIGPAISQPIDGGRIVLINKDDRLVAHEQPVEILVLKPVRMLQRGLERHQVDDIDEPDAPIGRCRRVDIDPPWLGSFTGNNNSDVTPAAQPMVDYRRQAIGVRRHPHHLRLFVGDVIDESRGLGVKHRCGLGRARSVVRRRARLAPLVCSRLFPAIWHAD